MSVYLYSWVPHQCKSDLTPDYSDVQRAIEQGKSYKITNYSVEVKSVELSDGTLLDEKRITFQFKGHNSRELIQQCPDYFFMEQRGRFSYLKKDRPAHSGKIFSLRCIIQIDDIKAPSENKRYSECY